jgi:hypothetical protein
MRRMKLTASYRQSGELIQRAITIPVPEDKEAEAFDFEAMLASKAVELSVSIINSNVDVVTWNDDETVPTQSISEMNVAVDDGLIVLTSPRLQDDPRTIMVFCPPSMEDFVMSGKFANMYKDIDQLYESMWWSDHDKDLIVYFKNGKTMRHKLEDETEEGRGGGS